MFKEKAFQIALVLSILTHGAILCNLPQFDINSLSKSMQKVEITYRYFSIPTSKLTTSVRPRLTVQQRKSTDTIYIKKRSNIFPPEFPKNFLSDARKNIQTKPNLVKKIQIDRKISLPTTVVKINNPIYHNYYQQIRDLIRKSAFRNFTRMHSGEVYLTFVVLSSGILKKMRLIEDKTNADDYLRQIALKSLTESSPFPPFPKELKYPQLSFNVIISFEIGD
jgi:hypothetical protein